MKKSLDHLIELFEYSETSKGFIKSKCKINYNVYLCANGYWNLKYKGQIYKVHRLIYLILNPCFDQSLEIDHIDRNRSNNNKTNLRAVSRIENLHNKSKYSNNKTGTSGITKRNVKGIEYFRVYIRNNNKLTEKYINISNFESEDQAFDFAKEIRTTLLSENNFSEGHGHD